MSYYQTIYNQLRRNGLTEAGALGMLGNWECESNCEPGRVQGDYSPYRTQSKIYVQGVTNGSISRYEFGHDGKGFGLYQLTYFSRKLGYYDFWKASGRPLDDAALQTDYAIKELSTGEYVCKFYESDTEFYIYGETVDLFKLLRETADIYSASKCICKFFEKPTINNIDARNSAALRIKEQIDLNNWDSDVPDDPDDPVIPTDRFWPPKRQICQGMSGGDVSVLKAILNALELYKYDEGEDVDIFGQSLREAVIAYQKQAFPNQPSEWDGIVGNKTWGKLLERG